MSRIARAWVTRGAWRCVAALGLLVEFGCVQTHVAAVVESEGSGGGGASSSTSSETSGSTSVASSSSGASSSSEGSAESSSSSTTGSTSECNLPVPLEDCDSSADPLRAFEVACYDGISDAGFQSLDLDAWRRAHEFGNALWVAEDTEAVLVLSTSRLPEPDQAGQVALEPSVAQDQPIDNDNANAAPLPEPIVLHEDCDGMGDCSGTLADAFDETAGADDLIWLHFDADVPPDAHSYVVQMGFITAEYPERIDEPLSDMFVWWTSSESFTGNLATLDGEPANVGGLASRMHEFSGEHPFLLRTGVDGTLPQPCEVAGRSLRECPIGATTGWLELRGPAVPGERLRVVAALFEQGEPGLDTAVVLDGFRWSCESCEPGQTCGLR